MFDDGRSYLVANIVFPGLEQSPGGALLFIPAKNTSGLSNGITAALTLLVFLFFALRTHLRTSADERGWRYYVLLGLFSLPILVLAYFGLSAQNFGRL